MRSDPRRRRAWAAFWTSVLLAVAAAVSYPGVTAARFGLLVLVALVVTIVLTYNAL